MEKSMDYNVTNCTQCPRHCPITDLQCKRGRQYMEHLGNGEADAEGGQEKMNQEDGMQEGQGAFAGHRRPMPHGHGGSGRHGEHGMRGEQGKHGMCGEQERHGVCGEQGRHGMSEEQRGHGMCEEQGRHGMRGGQGKHGMRGEQGRNEMSEEQGKHGMSGEQGRHGMSEEQGGHGMSGEQGRHGMRGGQGRHGMSGEQGRQGMREEQRGQGMRGEQGRHGMREEQGGHEIHGEYGRRKGHGRFGRRLEGMEGEDGLSALLGKCGHYLYHRPYHGRGQGRILKMLSGQEEVTQKELQETLGIQAGSVSEIISKLEARGLVARERDDADKRRVLLRITEEGKKRAETDFDEGKTEDLYGVLSEEEQETLKGLLGRLLESWGMTGQDPQ